MILDIINTIFKLYNFAFFNEKIDPFCLRRVIIKIYINLISVALTLFLKFKNLVNSYIYFKLFA